MAGYYEFSPYKMSGLGGPDAQRFRPVHPQHHCNGVQNRGKFAALTISPKD